MSRPRNSQGGAFCTAKAAVANFWLRTLPRGMIEEAARIMLASYLLVVDEEV